MVFGDFDADGLDGLAILTLALRRFGLAVEPVRAEPAGRRPRPVARGHRRGGRDWARRSSSRSTRGTSSAAEIAVAVARGIDVLVTDHHRVPPELPPALAVVNPHRADSVYPDRRLAGSGVAFKVAQLLLAGEPGGPAAALDLADLATIGTVADVAPIVGENRAIARLGLERLRRRPAAGHRRAAGPGPGRARRPSTSRPSRSRSPRA